MLRAARHGAPPRGVPLAERRSGILPATLTRRDPAGREPARAVAEPDWRSRGATRMLVHRLLCGSRHHGPIV